jgi:nickel-type superoxide dismutase maturation protease
MARWLGVYRVVGSSMEPTYRAGDVLIGSSWRRLKLGRVIVAHTDKPLIKRLTKIEDNKLWLEGDNSQQSTDSRSFGWISRNQLDAVIIGRIKRA